MFEPADVMCSQSERGIISTNNEYLIKQLVQGTFPDFKQIWLCISLLNQRIYN